MDWRDGADQAVISVPDKPSNVGTSKLRQRIPRTAVERVTEDVRALEGLGLEALREEWRRRYGEPPKLRSSDFLARLLAWRIQADAFGGIDPELKAQLLRTALPKVGPDLHPGMRLERQWKGRTEVVEVVEDGFRWRSHVYPSLTKVALAITGAKWNGPRFFGLRERS